MSDYRDDLKAKQAWSAGTQKAGELQKLREEQRLGFATSLPKDAAARKEYPIVTGVLDYFPDAIAEVAHVSFVGNQQHNPGQPLHWDRSKSTDQADTIGRHLLQRGTRDTDGVRHSAKVAWRALALLQEEIEQERRQYTTGPPIHGLDFSGPEYGGG
jgi:hypothetical protein